MSAGLRWRVGAVAALVLLFGYLALANFVSKEDRRESPLLPDDGLVLGLDLRGGFHWVVGVQLEAAEQQELEFLASNLVGSFEEDLGEEEGTAPTVSVAEGRLAVVLESPGQEQAVREAIDALGVLKVISEESGRFEYGLTASWLQEVRERSMQQVLEVLRRRIDDPVKGIPDSVVTRQGSDPRSGPDPGWLDRSSACSGSARLDRLSRVQAGARSGAE